MIQAPKDGKSLVSKVNDLLGLDRGKLQSRVKTKVVGAGAAGGGSFVNVSLQIENDSDDGVDCQWLREDGSRMRVRLPVKVVTEIVSSFLSGGSRS